MILPSLIRIARGQRAAIAGSCVTIRIVCVLRVEPMEQRHDVLGRRRVEVAGRLVAEQQRRLGHERACDRGALPLTTGELKRLVLHALREPDARQGLRRAIAAVARWHITAILERQLDVLQRRRAMQQLKALEHEADALIACACAVVIGEVLDVLACESIAT